MCTQSISPHIVQESLPMMAADAQNPARTAQGLSSPAINKDGIKSGGIVSKVSERRSKEGGIDRNSLRGKRVYRRSLHLCLQGVCQTFLQTRGDFSPCPAVSEAHREVTPASTDQCLFWDSNSSVEVFQASNSLRYYSCMISRARALYKLDMS